MDKLLKTQIAGIIFAVFLALTPPILIFIFSIIGNQPTNSTTDICNHRWLDSTCLKPSTCEYCGETRGEIGEHTFIEATCLQQKTCSECGITAGDYADHIFDGRTCVNCGYMNIPPSEWGFYNIEEMGGALVRIFAYDGNDPDNIFVAVYPYAMKFENNLVFEWTFQRSDNKCIFDTPITPYTYNVINNDNLVIGNYYKSYGIKKRITIPNSEDFVVFEVITEDNDVHWYVPYSLIDWERGAYQYPDGGSSGHFMLYIKN